MGAQPSISDLAKAVRRGVSQASGSFYDRVGICIENPNNTSQCINVYAVVCVSGGSTSLVRVETWDGTVLDDYTQVECTCDCVDMIADTCAGVAATAYEAELVFDWTAGYTVYLNGVLFHTLTGADFAAGGAALEAAFITAITNYYLTVPGTLSAPAPTVTVVNDGEIDTGALFEFTGCELTENLTVQILDGSLVEVDSQLFGVPV